MLQELNAGVMTIVLVTHEHDIAALHRAKCTFATVGWVSDQRKRRVRHAIRSLSGRRSRRMNALMVLRVALKALRVNKLRSSLTMLGMIIGVAAVIAMLAIGGGAQERVREQLKNLGSNLMLVFPGSTTASGVRLGAGAAQTLTEEDALAIAVHVEGVIVAAPSVRGSGQVSAGNANWATHISAPTRLLDCARLAAGVRTVVRACRHIVGRQGRADRADHCSATVRRS